MTQGETRNTDSEMNAADLLDRLRQSQNTETRNQITQEKTSENKVIDSDESGANNLEYIEDKAQQEKINQENGKLPPEARQALVSLLKNGVILAEKKSRLFEYICRYQSEVQSHLADIYLKLILDERAGVAFVAQIDEADSEEETVSLITRRTLSLYDTLLLLVLRKHYQERENAGEQRIIIDIERIESNLSPFLPLTNSAKSDRRKLISSLKKMLEKRILNLVRGSEGRFEITPVIRYVVNAEFLEKMLNEYQQLAREADLGTSARHGQQALETDEQDENE